jgi:hypothetical protein
VTGAAVGRGARGGNANANADQSQRRSGTAWNGRYRDVRREKWRADETVSGPGGSRYYAQWLLQAFNNDANRQPDAEA